MQNEPAITLNGKTLSPRELTLRELERVLDNLKTGQPHPIETVIAEEPISALALAISVGVDPDELMELTPSQVKRLAGMVREQNPSLARAIEDLGALAARLLAAVKEDPNQTALPESLTVSADQPAA